ncbi:MAG: hypothetical protein HC794_09265, partial [Nitrospiraceae bacterium]|nr:hypothetical protein [Nitrospiraceae bacterium]
SGLRDPAPDEGFLFGRVRDDDIRLLHRGGFLLFKQPAVLEEALVLLDPGLAAFGRFAERYFVDDPNTALIKTRQFAELLSVRIAESAGVPVDQRPNALMYLVSRSNLSVRIGGSSLAAWELVSGIGGHRLSDSSFLRHKDSCVWSPSLPAPLSLSPA